MCSAWENLRYSVTTAARRGREGGLIFGSKFAVVGVRLGCAAWNPHHTGARPSGYKAGGPADCEGFPDRDAPEGSVDGPRRRLGNSHGSPYNNSGAQALCFKWGVGRPRTGRFARVQNLPGRNVKGAKR